MATTIVPGALAGTAGDDDFRIERHRTWKRFRRHKLAIAGAAVLGILILIAIFARFLAPADPNFIDQVHWQGYPLAPGVAGHLLGTVENGRDLLSRLMYGAQISLTVALSAVAMEILIGTVLGAIAGYYGGYVDYWIMRLTDVFLSIPLLPLLLVLTAIVSATSNKAALSFGVIVLIIGALTWPSTARLVRGSFLSLREKNSPKRAARSRQPRRDGSSSVICCPNAVALDHRATNARHLRPSSCSSRRSRSSASASSRRPRRGVTCWRTPRRTCRSHLGSQSSRVCASSSPC